MVFQRGLCDVATMKRGFVWMLVAVIFLPCLLEAGDLPVITAEVGVPVLQELMGGCSLKCAFPWETAAVVPGKNAQPVYTLDDDDASTVWIDPSTMVGTRLVFQFPKKLAKELNGTPFYGFDLINGNIKTETLFKAYARLRKVELYYNEKPFCYVTFSDTRRWQHVMFADIMAKQDDAFTMEILEVYPGAKFPNAAITEIVLQGAH